MSEMEVDQLPIAVPKKEDAVVAEIVSKPFDGKSNIETSAHTPENGLLNVSGSKVPDLKVPDSKVQGSDSKVLGLEAPGLKVPGFVVPDVAWLNVLKRLPRNLRLTARSVCKQFDRILQKSEAWDDYEHLILERKLGHAAALRLRHLLPKVGQNVVTISFRNSVHTEHILLIARFCPNVKNFQFEVGLLNEQLHLIGVKFGAKLETLSLKKTFGDQEMVLERLFSRAKNLKELRLSRYCELNGGCLRSLSENLEVLVLPRNELLKFEWLLLLFGSVAMHHLRHLEMPCIELRNCAGDGFEEITELRCLRLPGSFVNPQLLHAVHHLQYLVELDLSRMRQIDTDAMRAISECINLRILNLAEAHGVNDSNILYLRRLVQLEYLNLNGINNLAPSRVVLLFKAADGNPELDCIKQLKVLGLQCENFPLMTTPYLAKLLPELEVLAVNCCDESNCDETVKLILQNPQKFRLRAVYVDDWEQMPDSLELESTTIPLRFVNDDFPWYELIADWSTLPLTLIPSDDVPVPPGEEAALAVEVEKISGDDHSVGDSSEGQIIEGGSEASLVDDEEETDEDEVTGDEDPPDRFDRE